LKAFVLALFVWVLIPATATAGSGWLPIPARTFHNCFK
jgi:hypothetical protein